MRVLFLTLYPETAASPRYRVAQFLPYLRAHGVECTVACALTPRQLERLSGPGRDGRALWYHLAETPRRLAHLLGARRYDVVFVQKAIMTAYLRGGLALLRRCGRPIVYDIDDAVHRDPPHPLRAVWRPLEDRRQVLKLMRAARLVLAGNAWLQAEAEAAGAATALFPTVVDTDRFAPAPRPPERFRVGWIGQPSTTPCLEPAREALAELEGAEVELVGAAPDAGGLARAAVRPWSLETEVAALHRFSVGVMPVPKVEWMRGKCGLKALLYMACGVPCVASPYGAALEIIEHGVNGLLADSTAEWREALERLRDPGLRRRLGEAGRATVEARYALRTAAPRMLETLESVR